MALADLAWTLQSRGAESWWGCFDSHSDSGLLIDSDSGTDTKYKTNNTLIVEGVSAVQAKKRNVTFPIDFVFRTGDFYPSYLSCLPDRICPPPPSKKIAAARSFICSDHVRAEQEHRLDGVLLAPGPQVRQEQPHWGEEPLDTGLRHPGAQRERRYRAAPQWGRMGSGSDGAV